MPFIGSDALDIKAFPVLREAVASGRRGIIKRYLDDRIELLSDPKQVEDDMKPYASKLVRFARTVRKVADLDEKLALDCFEDALGLVGCLSDEIKTIM